MKNTLVTDKNTPSTPHHLVLPTDKTILQTMQHGYRETPRNLSEQIPDLTRQYAANRLRSLEKRGYMINPGPADRSGMYQITLQGRVAADKMQYYVRDYDGLFHQLVQRVCDAQTPDNHPTPSAAIEFDGMIDTTHVDLQTNELEALETLSNTSGVTIPSQFSGSLGCSTDETAAILFSLFFFGLAERHDNIDVYSISDRGRDYLDELLPS